MSRTTRINLIAVALFSAALILYAVTQLLQAFVLDDSYPLYAELPRAAGLRADKEVTYNGHPVGRVEDVTVTATAARVQLAMEEGVKIPRNVNVVVLRRSPIGEQALDIRPIDAATAQPGATLAAADFYEPGDTIKINELTLPPDVQDLFETAVRVLKPVDEENTAALVSELADTVRGRKEDIRSILRDSADLSEAIADEGEDYDQLFASSRVVNRELAEHRQTLAGLFTDLRQATTVLSEGRNEFEAVLATAPPLLIEIADFVDQAQPNISCSMNDFANLNQMAAQPRNLNSGAEALRNNQYFFVGTEATTAYDPHGYNWFRVHVEGQQQGPPPESYLPDKRPVRPVWPGGACSSPFGPGAPSATQAGFQLRVPDARVERPKNDRQSRTIGDDDTGERGDGTVGLRGDDGSPPAPVAAAVPKQRLAATGADVVTLLLLGLITLAVGVLLVRRGRYFV